MKKYSTPLAIKNIKLKPQWDFTNHLSQWLELKNSDNTKCCQACGETGSHTLLVGT